MSFWKHITNLGIDATDDNASIRRIRLGNRMCFLSAISASLFVPYIYAIGSYFYAPILLGFSLLSCCYYFFSRKRYYRFSLFWVLFITTVNVFWGSLEAPGCGIEFFLLPLSLIPFTVIPNKRICFGFVAFTIVTILLAWYIKQTFIPHSFISDFNAKMTYTVSVVFVFVLCAIIIYQFRNINAKYEHIIHEQKLEVESIHKDIMDSIHYARRIQQSQLPSEKYIEKNWERLRNMKSKV